MSHTLFFPVTSFHLSPINGNELLHLETEKDVRYSFCVIGYFRHKYICVRLLPYYPPIQLILLSDICIVTQLTSKFILLRL